MLKKFRSSKAGNVAIIFALALVPLIVLIGGAIDLTRQFQHKTQLAAVTDQATLAAMRRYVETDDLTDIERRDAAYNAALNLINTQIPTLNQGQIEDIGWCITFIYDDGTVIAGPCNGAMTQAPAQAATSLEEMTIQATEDPESKGEIKKEGTTSKAEEGTTSKAEEGSSAEQQGFSLRLFQKIDDPVGNTPVTLDDSASKGTTSAGTTSAGTTSAGTTSAGTTSAGTTSAGTTSAGTTTGSAGDCSGGTTSSGGATGNYIRIRIDMTGNSQTTLAGFIGVSELAINTTATGVRGSNCTPSKGEYVLALDNTSSMFDVGNGSSQQRFQLLRDAAKGFVNIVYTDTNPGDVKVAVLPWASLVNIKSPAVAADDPATVPATSPPIWGDGTLDVAGQDRSAHLKHPDTSANMTMAEADTLAGAAPWRGCVRSHMGAGEGILDSSLAVTQTISDAAPTRWPAAILKPQVPVDPAPGETITCNWRSFPGMAPPSGSGGGGGSSSSSSSTSSSSGPSSSGTQGSLQPMNPSDVRSYADASGGIALRSKSRVIQAQNGQFCVPNNGSYVCWPGNYCFVVGTSGPPINGASQAVQCARLDKTYSMTYGPTFMSGKNNFYLAEPTNCYKVGASSVTTDPALNPTYNVQGWFSGQYNNSWNTDPYHMTNCQFTAIGTHECENATVTQELRPACVGDPNERNATICPWYQNIITPWDSKKSISGPNLNCPAPILPLSGNRGQVLAKLDQMFPVPGGTLPDVAVTWALRLFSPNNGWPAFWGLSSGNEPVAFNDADTKKTLILLSDGKIEPPEDFEGYYGCKRIDVTNNNGSPANIPHCGEMSPGSGVFYREDSHVYGTRCHRNCTRLQVGQAYGAPNNTTARQTAFKNLTVSACQKLRETYHVDIYTILVDVTDWNAIQMMRDCAGDQAKSFNITANELQATFEQIASNTSSSSIRLEH